MRVKLNLIDVTDETGRYRRATAEELAPSATRWRRWARRWSGATPAAPTSAPPAERWPPPAAAARTVVAAAGPLPRSSDSDYRRRGLARSQTILAAAHLLAGERADDLLGVGGGDVQIGVRVHDVDLGDVDRCRRGAESSSRTSCSDAPSLRPRFR